VELIAESFNLLNGDNGRRQMSDVGLLNSSEQFVQYDKALGINHFPAHFTSPSGMLKATGA
jgi:hypothetical protein